nr:hypothetical protein, SAM dependent methyltransferases family [uncultured archaeon]
MPPKLTESEKKEIEKALIEECYFYLKDEELNTDSMKWTIKAEAFLRYETCSQYIVPWIERYIDLENANIVEIGCGTGSLTVALAQSAHHVYAYDIQYTSINMTMRRARIMNLTNVTCYLKETNELLNAVYKNNISGIDVVVLYAVLEHMNLEQRLETLRVCWQVLKPYGIMVVGDTPNRLQYWDTHTSQLPFFNMLPDDLALIYYTKSPRDDFKNAIKGALLQSKTKALAELSKWGRGVSYHEFELAIGDINDFVVGDGFDKEILCHQLLEPEENALKDFVVRNNLDIPLAFTRNTISVILQKKI